MATFIYPGMCLLLTDVSMLILIERASNKMPAAVKLAIKNAARIEGGMSDDQAAKYLATMEWEGRLFEECWS